MQDPGPSQEASPEGKAGPARILIVEDSPTQAQQLQFCLEAEGFEVALAPNGTSALDTLCASGFDLVISGIVMPGISGYELCRRIKDDPATRHLPVILLTARNDPSSIIEALECGADNFLTKPCEPDDLTDRIRTILEHRARRSAGKEVGTDIVFHGKKLAVNSDKQQILNLLLATFEEVVRTNRELRRSQSELRAANAKVDEYTRQLEAWVRSSEDKYGRLMEQANDAIFLLNPLGRVLEINHRVEQLLGRPSVDIIGCPFVRLVSGASQDREGTLLQKLLADGSLRLHDLRLERPDGREVWVDLSASLVEIGGRRVALAIAHDVTERKRAEQRLVAQHATLQESEAQTRAILEAAVDAILTIDERGSIESLNPAAERLFGYPAAELLGQNVNMLMPPPYREQHDSYLRNYLATGEKKIIGITREVVGRRKDGSTFPIELAVSEVRLGDRRLFTGIMRDVSERKRGEEQLRLYAAALRERNIEL